MQDLASAVAAVESLNEYKRDPLKGQGKKISGGGKGGGGRDKSPNVTNPLRTMGKARRPTRP